MTDLKFFTNTDEDSLFERFVSILKNAQYFDVLSGYFRISGFHRLYQALEHSDNIRILIGIASDAKTSALVHSEAQRKLQFDPHQKIQTDYSKSLQNEFENEDETSEIELAEKKFREFIQSGKLELRAHPSKNIHAKIYISRFHENDRDFGRVITGSSNFSENGLVAQYEFNVELKDKADVEFAFNRFEELWQESVELKEIYVDTIKNKTWLNDEITPYEIYLKLLYEYFLEDINDDKNATARLPDNFIQLKYQQDAVQEAKKILYKHHGVFLADVVGLGKTFITSLLLQQLPNTKKLVVCPPALKSYWQDTLYQFDISAKVESLGKLDDINTSGKKYDVIVVDEAHRFRNEMTSRHQDLHKICMGKKVILVSATPFNNRLDDIKALVSLFQPLQKSSIPNIANLEAFFFKLQRNIDEYEKNSPEYSQALKENSEKVRNKVLKPLMVRRTRSEIKKYYAKDIQQPDVSFPKVSAPRKITYEFDNHIDSIFNQTIKMIAEFNYARYTSALYLKSQLSGFAQQPQRNIKGFMKTLLIKRLESSFHSFCKTIERFITSYEKFIAMFDGGEVWISKHIDVYDLLENDQPDVLLSALERGRAEKHNSEDFRSDYRDTLQKDLKQLRTIQANWQTIKTDPKKQAFIKELTQNPLLKNQKLIIFSEAKDTVDDLYQSLHRHFPSITASYFSGGGAHAGENHKVATMSRLIKQNYDPNHHEMRDDIKFLITTDVLAEGVNLHRANIIINYDLPWNPTKVLQRVGRVNRVGTRHKEIHVFNIFPTTQANAEIGLEENIISKLQVFHDVLGEDAKYLTDDEQVKAHGLFSKLDSKEIFDEEEDEGHSERYYLNAIRTIRDDNPDLFERIKKLPKKARSAQTTPDTQRLIEHGLVTYVRKGYAHSFASHDKELNFLDVATLFECQPDTKRQDIPQDYFAKLQTNKSYIAQLLDQEVYEVESQRSRGKNTRHLLQVIKTVKGKTPEYTEEDDAYLQKINTALQTGSLSKNLLKTIKNELKNNMQPMRILTIFRKHIPLSYLNNALKQKDTDSAKRETILNQYFIAKNKDEAS